MITYLTLSLSTVESVTTYLVLSVENINRPRRPLGNSAKNRFGNPDAQSYVVSARIIRVARNPIPQKSRGYSYIYLGRVTLNQAVFTGENKHDSN